MAINIPHRFLDRVVELPFQTKVNIIIIGTFNPGLPVIENLTEEELAIFEGIRTTSKFQTFNEVMNFYDRPQNRFWKIMDFLHMPEFYADGNYRLVNEYGIKYYRNMGNRLQVYERQQQFCQTKGIFITDIVQRIHPESFREIYDNFPDTAIERGNPDWNDQAISRIIREHQPSKVLINFNHNSDAIPNIRERIEGLINEYPQITFLNMPSTSGAAGGKYDELIPIWQQHF